MKLNYRLSILLFFAIRILFVHAQGINFQKEDLVIYEQYTDYIKAKDYKDKIELLQATAEFFLDRPYVSATLDQNKNEALVVNLREFDCVTFIESVIALSNTVESGDFTFHNFVSHLKLIRYRDGEIVDYSSRLHYTSDWVFVHQESGILTPIEWKSENVLTTKTINFMSTHRHAYRALKDDDEMLGKIKQIESDINARGGFVFLPKSKIANNADKIPHMAVIAFTTKIEGLDTTHTGFTYIKDNGELGFIHASSLKKKVVVDEKSLSDYCLSQKSCTGLMIMRVE